MEPTMPNEEVGGFADIGPKMSAAAPLQRETKRYVIYDADIVNNISLFMRGLLRHDHYRWFPLLDRPEVLLCCKEDPLADAFGPAATKNLVKDARARLAEFCEPGSASQAELSDRSACMFAYLCQNVYVRAPPSSSARLQGVAVDDAATTSMASLADLWSLLQLEAEGRSSSSSTSTSYSTSYSTLTSTSSSTSSSTSTSSSLASTAHAEILQRFAKIATNGIHKGLYQQMLYVFETLRMCKFAFLEDRTDLAKLVVKNLMNEREIGKIRLSDLSLVHELVFYDENKDAANQNIIIDDDNNNKEPFFRLTRFIEDKFGHQFREGDVRAYISSLNTNMCMKRRFREYTLDDIDRVFMLIDGRCYDLFDLVVDLFRYKGPSEHVVGLDKNTKSYIQTRACNFLVKHSEERTVLHDFLRQMTESSPSDAVTLAKLVFSNANSVAKASTIGLADAKNIVSAFGVESMDAGVMDRTLGQLLSGEYRRKLLDVAALELSRRTCFTIFDFVGLIGFVNLSGVSAASGTATKASLEHPEFALAQLDRVLSQLDRVASDKLGKKALENLLVGSVDAASPTPLLSATKALLDSSISFSKFGAALIEGYVQAYRLMGTQWPIAPFMALPTSELREVMPDLLALTCARAEDVPETTKNPLSCVYRVYGVFQPAPVEPAAETPVETSASSRFPACVHLVDIDLSKDFRTTEFKKIESYLERFSPVVESYSIFAAPPASPYGSSVVHAVRGSARARALKVFLDADFERGPESLAWRLLSIPDTFQTERKAIIRAAADHLIDLAKLVHKNGYVNDDDVDADLPPLVHRDRPVVDADDLMKKEMLQQQYGGIKPGGGRQRAADDALSCENNRFFTMIPDSNDGHRVTEVSLQMFLMKHEYSWPKDEALPQPDGNEPARSRGESKRARVRDAVGKDITMQYQKAELIGRLFVPRSIPSEFYSTYDAYFQRVSQKALKLWHLPFVGLDMANSNMSRRVADVAAARPLAAANACDVLDRLVEANEEVLSARILTRMKVFVLLWRAYSFGLVSGDRAEEARSFVLSARPSFVARTPSSPVEPDGVRDEKEEERRYYGGVGELFRFETRTAVCAFTFPDGVVNRAVGFHHAALLRDVFFFRELGEKLAKKARRMEANMSELGSIGFTSPSVAAVNAPMVELYRTTGKWLERKLVYYSPAELVLGADQSDAMQFKFRSMIKAKLVTDTHVVAATTVTVFVEETLSLFKGLDKQQTRKQLLQRLSATPLVEQLGLLPPSAADRAADSSSNDDDDDLVSLLDGLLTYVSNRPKLDTDMMRSLYSSFLIRT